MKTLTVFICAACMALSVQDISAQGRTVMPGFVEAHCHVIRGDGGQWLIVNGDPLANVPILLNVTTVIKGGEAVVNKR